MLVSKEAPDAGQCSRAEQIARCILSSTTGAGAAKADPHLQLVGVHAAHHLAHQLAAAVALEVGGASGHSAAHQQITQRLNCLAST